MSCYEKTPLHADIIKIELECRERHNQQYFTNVMKNMGNETVNTWSISFHFVL